MMLRSIVALDKVCVCSTSLYLPALVYVRQMNTRVNMSSRASYPTAHAILLPVEFRLPLSLFTLLVLNTLHPYPNPLPTQPRHRNEEVMRHLHIPDIRLQKLELVPAEHHAEREVEFCPCETVGWGLASGKGLEVARYGGRKGE